MKVLRAIIRKEFIQIFRDRTMLPIILIVPFVQLVVLVYAATLEMKNIEMVVVDQDRTVSSRTLISHFYGSPFFTVTNQPDNNRPETEAKLLSGKADMVITIPEGFESDLVNGEAVQVQFEVDAINATAAGLSNAYASDVLRDFATELAGQRAIPGMVLPKHINIIPSYWYNPDLNYKIYMLPGILVVLVTLIGSFLTAINIVREKEMGTIEQINVTPVKKYQFILGKLIPFLIIALCELAFGLTFGHFVFKLPIEGNLLVLFGFATVYLLVALGFGLLLSTLADTQQQVMFLMFFFLLTFILMSGIFTPVESMPDWAIWLNTINPLAYFMRVIRMVLLKGSGVADIIKEGLSLLIYGTLLLSLAVWRYRKTI